MSSKLTKTTFCINFNIFTDMSAHVGKSAHCLRVTVVLLKPSEATLRLFPGISASTIRAFCQEPIRGVVLETFGAGNAPSRSEIREALKEACELGVIIVAITQCTKGTVSDAYETGRTLQQAGVIPGSDMTPEVRG